MAQDCQRALVTIMKYNKCENYIKCIRYDLTSNYRYKFL